MIKKIIHFCQQHRFSLLSTLTYAILITILSNFHEVWRDEVVPLSFVRESHTLGELFHNIHNYGHPSLWFLLLYIGHNLWPHMLILKILNLSIATITAFLILHKSPFARPINYLLLTGLYPLYLYPIINRPYGLCFLLIILISLSFGRRHQHPWPLALWLILLANTHAQGLVLTIAIILGLLAEHLWLTFTRPCQKQRGGLHFWTSLSVTLIGLTLAISMIIPDSHSVIIDPTKALNGANILRSLLITLILPGKNFTEVFGLDNSIFVSFIIYGLAVALLRRWPLSLLFLTGAYGLNLFASLFFPHGSLRHQSFLYLWIIFTLWTAHNMPPKPIPFVRGRLREWIHYIDQHTTIVWGMLLIMLMCQGLLAIKRDLLHDYSASQRLAQFIQQHPQWADAIIISEPDYLSEALPYYIDNPIYLYREKLYRNRTRFTIDNQQHITLKELLAAAVEQKSRQGKEVLVLMGHTLSQTTTPTRIDFSYAASFTYTPESLRQWHKTTKRIAQFPDAITDEHYDVFLIRDTLLTQPIKNAPTQIE